MFGGTLAILLCVSYSHAESAFQEQEQVQEHQQDQRQLLQLVEYIGVDYSAAVQDGQIVDQGEYREMQDFVAIIVESFEKRSKSQPSLLALANKLSEAIDLKHSITDIQSFTTSLKRQLLENSPQLSLPKTLLAENEVQQIFANQCASCHGESGQGNGILAKGLTPEPTDFTDQERAMNRSIMGLYDVISGGLDGTAMSGFTQLNDQQRWSLAFHVGGMAFTDAYTGSANTGSELLSAESSVSLTSLVNFSPKEILDGESNSNDKNKSDNQNLSETIKQLRANPLPLFLEPSDPFEIALKQLNEAALAYQNNNFERANNLAVSAYLDGFELVENSLDIHDKLLRKDIEARLLNLRRLLKVSGNDLLVEQSIAEIIELLTKAKKRVNDSSMSDLALFSASFIILLREGLEALLVVLALFTILVKSKKESAIKFIHYGWISALVLGLFTWYTAQYLIAISGASREIMEGVAAMLAAVILFYVGFWMHSKSQASQWQQYIQENINKSLTTGTLWGISGLAFIAVYREVFETVLFYQSLMTQSAESQEMVLLGGFVFASLILILLAWLMIKYSVKLPIGRFFSSTSYLLLLLSFVLIGKAVSALQEAAIFSISPMPISYELEWLGINSTWQSFAAQFIILMLSLGLILKTQFKAKA
ncbi:MAG: iron permease [Gammaproteobacteria bacterium]|nr:MAG: iron permease [Gammaproteobacteria bacterium]